MVCAKTLCQWEYYESARWIFSDMSAHASKQDKFPLSVEPSEFQKKSEVKKKIEELITSVGKL